MPYSILPQEYHSIADSAKTRLETKYSIRITNYETSIKSEIEYVPTFWGKTKFHFVVCEVASRPFPVHLKSIYADIFNQSLPIKLFITYTNSSLNTTELNKDIALARKFGVGLLNVDENNIVNVVYEPVSIPLFIPESTIDYKKLTKKLSHKVEEAYAVYIGGNPRQGVQAIGQIVERVIRNIGIQRYGTAPYTTGPNPASDSASFGNIVDEMIKHSILKPTFLNRVRGFVDDRNSTSHIAKNIKQQSTLEKKYKLLFETGLRILEDIPLIIKEKNLKLKRIDWVFFKLSHLW